MLSLSVNIFFGFKLYFYVVGEIKNILLFVKCLFFY